MNFLFPNNEFTTSLDTKSLYPIDDVRLLLLSSCEEEKKKRPRPSPLPSSSSSTASFFCTRNPQPSPKRRRNCVINVNDNDDNDNGVIPISILLGQAKQFIRVAKKMLTKIDAQRTYKPITHSEYWDKGH